MNSKRKKGKTKGEINMKTTYTNEQLIERLTHEKIPYREIVKLCQEPYSEEVFIHGIKMEKISLYQIPDENQTEAIQLAGVEKSPWHYRHVKSPSYAISLRAIELEPYLLSKVPKEQRTEELCDLAIESAIKIRQEKKNRQVCKLSSIPKALRTPERIQRFLQVDGTALKQLDLNEDEKKPESKELIRQAIRTTPKIIKEMDLTTLDESELILAMSLEGGLLEVIPETLRTEAVIEAALKQDGYAIQFIEQPTLKQLETLLEHHPHAFRMVQGSIPFHLLKRAIASSYYAFNHDRYGENPVIISHYLGALTEQSKMPYCHYYEDFLESSNPAIKEEMHYFLAKECGRLESGMTFESHLLALSSPIEGSRVIANSFSRKSSLPTPLVHWLMNTFLSDLNHEEMKRYDQFKAKDRLKLIKEDGLKIREIAIERQTKKLARLALKQNPEALKYIHPNLKDYQMCRMAVQQCPDLKLYSPYHVESEISERLAKTKQLSQYVKTN